MSFAQTPRRGRLAALRTTFASIPRRALVRFALLAAVLAAGLLLLRWPPIAAHLTREMLMQLLEQLRSHWWSPLVLIALYGLVGCLGLPASPLLIAGGAVFGAGLGTLYNMLGLMLGAWLSFLLGQHFGRDLIVHLGGDKLRRAERLFHRRGFWPLVTLRFLPVPFAAINYGAALAGVRSGRFLAASAVGMAPATLMHTLFASWLAGSAAGQRLMVLSLWITAWLGTALLTTLPTWLEARARKRRYRRVTAQRRLKQTGQNLVS